MRMALSELPLCVMSVCVVWVSQKPRPYPGLCGVVEGLPTAARGTPTSGSQFSPRLLRSLLQPGGGKGPKTLSTAGRLSQNSGPCWPAFGAVGVPHPCWWPELAQHLAAHSQPPQTSFLQK